MVAWVIGAFTSVLGDHSLLAIRGGALVGGTGTLLLVHRLARRLFDDQALASRALLLALCLPLVNVLGVVVAPEGLMLFFHLLALDQVATALRTGRGRPFYLAGVAIGLALLCGLAAGLAILALALWLLGRSPRRGWLRRKEPYLALLLAALVFLPFVSWNAAHDWVSLQLLLWTRPLQSFRFSFVKTGETLVEQLANTSVFLAAPLLGALAVRPAAVPPAWRDGFQLLQCQALVTLLFFLAVGTVSQTHPHWTVLAYPPAAILLAILWTAGRPRGLIRGLGWWVTLAQVTLVGLALFVLTGLTMLSRVPFERLGGAMGRGLATAKVRLLGWTDLTRQIEPFLAGAAADGLPVLFAYGHQRASLLWFHRGGGAPVVNLQAYARRGTRVGDAQWYYLPVESLDGCGGILVTEAAWLTEDRLRAVFAQVEAAGVIEQQHAGWVVARHRLFRVRGLSAAAIRQAEPASPWGETAEPGTLGRSPPRSPTSGPGCRLAGEATALALRR